MSAAERWIANRRFKGVDLNGEPCDFKHGDPVPGVEKWPTFTSLKNIAWIVPNEEDTRPGATSRDKKTASSKTEDSKSNETVEATKPVKKKAGSKKKKSTAKVKKDSETSNQPSADERFKCSTCGKEYATSRALKVHERYH